MVSSFMVLTTNRQLALEALHISSCNITLVAVRAILVIDKRHIWEGTLTDGADKAVIMPRFTQGFHVASCRDHFITMPTMRGVSCFVMFSAVRGSFMSNEMFPHQVQRAPSCVVTDEAVSVELVAFHL
jgi:hypothetical protein